MADEPTELAEYTVTLNGIEHTMLLNDEDAERYGDTATKAGAKSKAKTPANKSRTAQDK